MPTPLGLVDVLQLCLTLMCGWLGALVIGRRFGLLATRSTLIFFYHALFGFAYALYALQNSADATKYIAQADLYGRTPLLGNESIPYMTAVLVDYLGLGYFAVFQVFAFVGVVGLLALDGSLQWVCTGKNPWIQRVASWVVFLPTANFWTAAIGKDGFALTAVCLVMWAAFDLKRRISLVVLGVALLFYVRPHIGGLMAIAVAVAFIFEPKIKPAYRLVLMVGAGLTSVALVYFVSYLLDIPFDLAELIHFIERRQIMNQQGVSSIAITDTSVAEKMLSFVFRPLPFELSGPLAMVVALENIFYMGLAVLVMTFGWVATGPRQPLNNLLVWTYALATWLILALTIPNLGIAVRQKWMFLPLLLVIGFNVWGSRAQRTAPLNGLAT